MPYFTTDIKDNIATIIADGIVQSGSRLLALKVMPNHLHIVLLQGATSLGWIMQPILRRVALQVQRRHDLEGHVFGRRFDSFLVDNADYMRTVIAYVHRNAYRAGLCTLHSDYRWTTHRAYRSDEISCPWEEKVDFETGLRMFAESPDSSLADLRRNYLDYISWWDEWDNSRKRGEHSRSKQPFAIAGNDFWNATVAHVPDIASAPEADLRDAARAIIAREYPACDLEQLRGSGIGRELVPVRKIVLKLLRADGYSCTKIARTFNVSPATVSLARN